MESRNMLVTRVLDVLNKQHQWIENTIPSGFDDSKIFEQSDIITREEFPLFAKQAAAERVIETLCHWFNDPTKTNYDLKGILTCEIDNFQVTCEHCVDYMAITRGLSMSGKRIPWYTEPTKI